MNGNVCEQRLAKSIVNEDWLISNCTGLTLDDSRTDDESAWLYYSNDDGGLNLLVLASLAGDQKTVDLNYIAGVDLDMPEEYEKHFDEGEEQQLLEFLKADKKIHKMNIKLITLKRILKND